MTETIEFMPFLSIITVTKDNLKGLRATHSSIAQQSSSDYEWIVVDGASEDQTVEFLQEIKADYTSEPDKSLYDAMNKGITRARGAYTLFLNAGDAFADSLTIAHLVKAATNGPDFIYGDSYENNLYKTARKPSIKHGMFTHHQSMLYKTELFENLRYSLEYKIAADYEFTALFLKKARDIEYLPQAICNFEPDGVSQQYATTGRKEQQRIRRKLKLCSNIENIFITALQACAWKLRALAPTLYWRLKSSGNTARGNSQNDTPPHHQENQT